MKISYKPTSLFFPGTGLKGLRNLLCAALLAPVAAMAQPGSLDPGFDGDGRTTIIVQNFASAANAIAIQDDGKIVTAGFATEPESFATPAVTRQNPDGSLDTDFGFENSGTSTMYAAPEGTRVNAVVIQPDGKILAGGIITNAFKGSVALFRFNADGSIDTSFGNVGVIPATALHHIVDLSFGIVDMVLQDDGKIVAALSSPESRRFLVARFLQDGSLDTSFDVDGVADFPPGAPATASSLALQSDGKIVVGGDFNGNLTLLRLDSNGNLNFAGQLPRNGTQVAADLTLQSDDKMLLAGFEDDGSGLNTTLVLRLTANGALDTTFANGTGLFADSLFFGGNTASAIALQADGKILVSGHTIAGESARESEFSLARLNQDGSLDTGFGNNGRVSTSFDPTTDSQANDLAVQADGKIVLVGFSHDDFALARYLSD